MSRQSDSRQTSKRGFTLIELLVAIMAGLLVATAAVSFSRQATRFFAQESRIASAQMSVLAGFQRLQADLARSAYMAPTDMARDYAANKICAPNYDTWPGSVKELTSIRISSATSKPDVVRVAGNLDSSEMFPVLAIAAKGTGHEVFLQTNNGPMTRAGFIPSASARDAAFQAVFRPGRLIRILDDQGKYEYEIIKSSSYSASPVITTVGRLPLRSEISMASGATSASCGLSDGLGTQINPISVVEYRIANLSALSPYKDTIYHENYRVADSDANRMELVRSEVLLLESSGSGSGGAGGAGGAGGSGSTLPSLTEQPEIVAEFAVDLKVGVWTTSTASGGVVRGNLRYLAPGSAAGATLPTVALAPVGGPTAIRALDLRLVVRSREADRSETIDEVANPLVSDGYMFRSKVSEGRWARTRTLTATISLMNHRGEAW